jgi:hypothetical protein
MRAREVALRDGFAVYLAMMFLAVTFGEFMTGGIAATPFGLLGVFVVPPFVVVSLTYGLGVLLVREASIRFQKGWAGTLLLGVANAWVLQGIFTKVIFGPASSPNIGPLGSYGHWLGVSWVYVAVAIYFDAILATVLPIFLTNECLPRAKGRRLLSDPVMVLVGVGYALLLAWEDIYINANNGILPSGAHPFVSSLTSVQLVVFLSAVVGLWILAWRIPDSLLLPSTPRPVGSPWEMFGLGVVLTVSTLLVEGLAWQVVPWPAAVLAIYGLSSALILWWVHRRIGRTANLSHCAALVAGLLAIWAFTDVFREAGGDVLVLPIAVGVFAILAWLWKKGTQEYDPSPSSPVTMAKTSA